MIGENTGLTYKNMKPYELAEIVGFDGNNPEVKDSFGSLLFHDGKRVILIRNNNQYFFMDNDYPEFLNIWYSIKIVYSPYKNLTYKDLKPGQCAKVIGSVNPNNPYQKDWYGCIVKCKTKDEVIIVDGINEMQISYIGAEFRNDIYYFEIINEYKEKKPQKLTLEDVLKLKSGDKFYYNYGCQHLSIECYFIRLTTNFDGDLPTNDPQKLIIEFNTSYDRKDSSHLTDCGVIPYSYKSAGVADNNGFNKYNCLTLEPLYYV